MRPRALLRLLRIPHWIKNLIALLPLVFARRLSDPGAYASVLGDLPTALAEWCAWCRGSRCMSSGRSTTGWR